MLTVCLDSGDYSALATRPELQTTLASLQRLRDEGAARYVYSFAHLSEIAPLGARYSDAAVGRADILASLCGTNALISGDRLIDMEMANLTVDHGPQAAVISTDGNWHPDFGEEGLLTELEPKHERDLLESSLTGSSRKERRKFLVNGAVTALGKKRLGLAVQAAVDATLAKYPMQPADASILAQYALGRASKQSAEEAFLHSIRDPRWMMRWFEKNFDKLSAFSEWVRLPAREMRDATVDLVTLGEKWVALEGIDGSEAKLAAWLEMSKPSIFGLVRGQLKKRHPEAVPPASLEQLQGKCPGTYAFAKILHILIWLAITNGRKITESDIVDALHAMYAPYVDLFRADRSMAPHVRSAMKTGNRRVVSRLADLPSAIEQAQQA